jgi:DNA-binding transcriptional LysR family regulator
MDLRLLRYFVACVENRTMHAAARAVHVSQPALSKAIANLEGELGVQLLDRQPRGVTPTPYGETLFRYAKMIDSEMRRAVAELDAMRGMTRGTIVVGVIPTMTEIMGEVALEVMAAHPGLRLKLRVAFSAELRPALLDGEIDFALLLLPGEGAPPGLAFEPLLRTGPVVAVRAGHPLAHGAKLSLPELASFPWLIPDYPASHREIVSRAFIDAGLPAPRTAVEVSTVIFFDRLVRESDLVTVVPATLFTARGVDRGLVTLDTDFDFPPEKVGLAFRENSTLLPGARVVVGLIRTLCLKIAGDDATPALVANR